jgi:broad specificity phosphatase PhoE
MEIIIVRHGLSEANKAGIIGTDSNLAIEGERQAKELAERLQSRDIDVVYCSPLKRTSQTALPIAEKLNKEINIDHRIREVDWGDFDGQPDAFFMSKIGMPPSDALNSYGYDFRKHNGESAADVETRVKSFVDDLKEKPYESVLIVSHGGIVRMLHFVITGQKITKPSNGQEIHLKI